MNEEPLLPKLVPPSKQKAYVKAYDHQRNIAPGRKDHFRNEYQKRKEYYQTYYLRIKEKRKMYYEANKARWHQWYLNRKKVVSP